MDVIIKATNPAIKAIKLAVPYDGIIEVNANGEATVSEKCANLLVKGTHDWKFLNEEDGDGTDENVNEQEDKNIADNIKKMSLKELIAMAEEAGFEKKEWNKFAKNTKAAQKLMAAYLIKKLEEQETANVDAKNASNEETDKGNEGEAKNPAEGE
jgi:L-cysteine desulfidase